MIHLCNRSVVCMNIMVWSFDRWGDCQAIDDYRWHRAFRFDSQGSNTFSHGQNIAPSRRQPLQGFIMRAERRSDLLRDKVQIADTHAHLVA